MNYLNLYYASSLFDCLAAGHEKGRPCAEGRLRRNFGKSDIFTGSAVRA